ncbi:S8 family serine peptidase [Streptomyces sp. NPDC051940]|uniref:S8 family serine peptidase n=1 Tax=Streptomyces sp. NPDC051940 TaxID=3155675 RepID=UPI0034191943
MSGRWSVARGWWTAVACLLVLAALAAAGTPAAQAAPNDDGKDRIRPGLLKQLESGGRADFWVRFDARPDLSQAAGTADWDRRGARVVEALKATAAKSQGRVVAALEKAGTDYEAFWATNAVFVRDGSLSLARSLQAQTGVDELWPSQTYGAVEPVAAVDESAQAVEWGVGNLHADDVWSQLGVDGQGIVVASIDSGVQYDHPALVKQYRGNNGDGTFSHDYNWFDTDGNCASGAPCDTDGHGTHTMGTMVGSDGGANRIGVAPGARWITANGCDTCSDADLAEAGQWMLAPTRTDGTDPDPSKRPNIINNSWGTTTPTNDPFMEDVSAAWTASGIFGVWSNGNSGPQCRTSGSPGSRTINYSVGAYDVSNRIASFSSRGSGQDGAVKPDISAPGVNIRSSVPGSAYGTASGTSMAAPHAAGAIALLWAAQPDLIGDIQGTRNLLDDTAVDTEDLQCGGTADDNNVYGEGRLDALALVEAADTGPSGTLSGQVTDTATGDPVPGATVRVTGDGYDKTLTADGSGGFERRLRAGEYQLTASAFGYETRTVTATVVADTTTRTTLALTAYETSAVSGRITDGSGHGWPLYTKITVAGVPSGVYYSDPETGRYSVKLPEGDSYDLKFTPVYPGYETVTRTVDLGADDVARDLAVRVDENRCSAANGYAYHYDGIFADFNTGKLPAGWTIVDHIGTRGVWSFEDPYNRGNHTGGDGKFVMVDSDYYDWENKQDTSLVMPVMDLSDQQAPVIGFNQDYNNYQTELADVDLSLDGGTTWQNVLRQTADARGPRFTSIPIPQAAGKSNVRVRFHYYKAEFDWFWQLDDVFVGTRSCDLVAGGGYLVGDVTDANTGAGVSGATVRTGSVTAKAAPTGDGSYWMFTPTAGAHDVTASADNYLSHTRQTDVDGVVRADFTLKAGELTVAPAGVDATQELGERTATRTFTVTNTGTAPAAVKFGESGSGFVLQRADGAAQSRQQLEALSGAPLQRLRTPASLAATSDTSDTPVEEGPSAAPWTPVANYPQTIMDNRVVRLDGRIYSIGGVDTGAATAKTYVYDPATLRWSQAAPLPATRNAITAGVVNGQIVASAGWGSSGPAADTWVYDPAADTWTAAARNPAPRAAAGQAVLDGRLYAVGGCTSSACTPTSATVVSYDPVADTWQRLADYPQSVAFASCGALDGRVVCTGGSDGTAATKATYAYDPGADRWSRLADAPVDTWGSSYAVASGELVVAAGVQAGAISNGVYAYNRTTDSWRNLPNANSARYRGGAACGFYKIGGSSGGGNSTGTNEVLPGFDQCDDGTADAPWLSVDREQAALAPGDSVTVTVAMDARVDQPGTYSSSVWLHEDTPYTVPPVPVKMTVTPPRTWGKLAGTVRGVACDGTAAALAGAVVAVDSAAVDWTFTTRADGAYAVWIDRAYNPLKVVAAKDGYRTQGADARISGRTTTTVDFDLAKLVC